MLSSAKIFRPGFLLGLSLLAIACLAPNPIRAAAANEVIIPGATQRAEAAAGTSPAYGAISVLGVLVLAGAGAWMLIRGRKLNVTMGNRDVRLLNITETKSLGNRQYLVVATYEDKKFLLGVCPGRIDLLSTLESRSSPEQTS